MYSICTDIRCLWIGFCFEYDVAVLGFCWVVAFCSRNCGEGALHMGCEFITLSTGNQLIHELSVTSEGLSRDVKWRSMSVVVQDAYSTISGISLHQKFLLYWLTLNLFEKEMTPIGSAIAL